MKKIMLVLLLISSMVSVNARVNTGRHSGVLRDAESVMADAKLKFTQGSNDVFMADDNTNWRNGIFECNADSYYDKNDQPIGKSFYLNCCDKELRSKHYYEVQLVKGKPQVVNRPGVKVEHLVAGQWDMLVFRNAHGAVLDVALSTKYDNEDEAIDDLRDMINGVYAGTGKNSSDTVMFGEVCGNNSNFLPGAGYRLDYREYTNDGPKLYDKFQVAYFPERMKRVRLPELTRKADDNGVMHYYADGEEITKQAFEHFMAPGYGGHASLHGPLLWWVKPQGDNIAVELNEPFQEELDAFYSNFRDEKFSLKWVRSPYKDYSNRWTVLSMRPVTRGMLKFFEKESLRLMLDYLNARKNPTDIEKLNKSLLNTIVNGAVATNKAGKTGKPGKSGTSRKSRKK